MTATRAEWSVPGSDGEPVLGVTDTPAAGAGSGSADRADAHVVLAHGFKGYYDYGLFPVLARAAVAAGLTVHRFNFSHSGVTRDSAVFARPDLFAADRWSRQQADLDAVFDHLERTGGPPPSARRVLFGHSRGGLSALLWAARHGGRLAGLVSAAAPADAERLSDTQKRLLKKHGAMPSPSGRTGQELQVERGWLDEIEADPPRFDPARAVAAAPAALPVLLLHGDADDTVSADDLRRLHAARPAAEAAVLPGANHVFNVANPHPEADPLDPVAADFVERFVTFAVRVTRPGGEYP